MKNLLSSVSNDALRQWTARASMAVAALLIVAKFFTYFQTGSVALLSSLVDSGIDLLASSITAFGIAKAGKPPDKDHRFGHGKAEALAAAAQTLFILGSSVFLVIEAFQRIVAPRILENEHLGYAVMGFAVVMTCGLLALQTYTIRRTKSLAIASDRLHYVGDVLINIAVMGAFFLQKKLEVAWIDPLFAIFIAGGMFAAAAKIGRATVDVLMDAELPEKERQDILVVAKNVPGVVDVHDLRTRSDGEKLFIEIHVEMDSEIPLREAHDIAEAVMNALSKAHGGADVLVHQDPAGVGEERLDALIERNDGDTFHV